MKREPYDETMTSRVSLHPFLAGMNRTQLALLTDCAVSIRFDGGDIILKEGQPADRFYLVETGKVALEAVTDHGRPVVIDTIGAGDLLGWSWMFPPHSWQFTAQAITGTRAIFFEGRVLREYCERDHSLGYQLLKRITAVMTRRLQNARRMMVGVQSGNLRLPPVVLECIDNATAGFEAFPRVEQFREGAD